MKSGRPLVDLARELERQLSSKRDLVVPSSFLQCRTEADRNVKLIVDPAKATANTGVTDLARRQLDEKLKIPFAYFERMRHRAARTARSQREHWLQAEGERRMIRTLDGQVRAVLSDCYRRLDNFDSGGERSADPARSGGARFGRSS